ncbi:S1/P1 nuclease [Sphingomicrobium flavum]|uniref:S1/P1 nuclease n=1 Tax=Sphingomicrobium flavum TaxID=1229164 RepID=UPI0021ADF6D1|nr:S1/P1 nuclease [Sphingomicrobium flavum]
MLRWIAAIAASLSLVIAAPAAAYWEYGHGIVARIAYNEVQPETRAKIRALMAQDRLLQTPECRIRNVEDASYWADCIKQYGDRYAYAFSWHYQNVSICKDFDLSGPCKDGHCVAAQVERQARLLADTALPTRDRVEALAFLMHFVGDLHQPMHAGDNEDLGGNRVAANYGLIGGRTNLHSIWDGYLAERSISTPPGGARGVIAPFTRAELEAMKGGNVVDWSREMWAMSRDVAYPSLVDRNPCDGEVEGRPTLTEEDVQALIPAAREAAVKGGMRLAKLLDDALLRGEAPPFRRL